MVSEGTRALARVSQHIGLIDKVLDEARKEFWEEKLNGLQTKKCFEELLIESEGYLWGRFRSTEPSFIVGFG